LVTLTERLSDLALFEITAVAALTSWHWWRRRSRPAGWVASAFVLLTIVSVAGKVAEHYPVIITTMWVVKLLVGTLLVVPYLLFRFASTFGTPPRWVRASAALTTIAALAWTAALPYFPLPGMPEPREFLMYRVAVGTQWCFVFSYLALRMWRASNGQPNSAKERARLLALGAAGLEVPVLLGTLGLGARPGVALFGQAMSVVSTALFWCGFCPPAPLRSRWRGKQAAALHAARAGLVAARSRSEVASSLVPHLAELTGAKGVEVRDAGGTALACHGVVSNGSTDAMRFPAGDHGSLIVSTDPYLPYFAAEEIDTLTGLGDLIGMALERCDALEREQQLIAERHRADRKFEDLLEAAPDAIVVVDSEGVIRLINRQTEVLFGYGRDELLGQPIEALLPFDVRGRHPDLRAGYFAEPRLRPMGVGLDLAARRKDGGQFPVDISLSPLETDQGLLVSAAIRDVTERKRAEDAIAHQALHDSLTGLPNRMLLDERLAHALTRCRSIGSSVAVLFIDVDRFKLINDGRGHSVGDRLLGVLAQRLSDAVRPGDIVARFGGDEFVVVMEDVRNPREPSVLAERLARTLAQPVDLGDTNVTVTASIGVAVSGEDDNPESLLRDADAAMYRAKEEGRDRRVTFDATMREYVRNRLDLESALRAALAQGETSAYYQPILSLNGSHTVGVEALARWPHAELGILLPDRFVPLAEESGLIVPLGAAVLHQACAQLARWHQSPQLRSLALSVNFSARQLLSSELVPGVRDALADSGVPPHRLCIEITESVLLDDFDASSRALKALKDLGVRIAVDDFGTGYSSLTYLKRFPLDVLKIDQAFVAGLGTRAEDRAIVTGIVDLAHAFGLTTVAEGIENVDQLRALEALGCQLGQGFYWSPPLAAADAEQWLTTAADRHPRPLALVGPRRRRVVVIDDDRSLRELFRLILSDDEDFELVGVAADGREGIALTRDHRPDVVLLDLAMPGMGGLEALPLLRAVSPDSQVIVMSGLDDAEVAGLARARGAAGFVRKGGDPHTLLDYVRRPRAAAS
jgi:diguanylate cyclase (GGDEF)-like protein/PAS domain S-box-containing protein